MKTFRTFDLAVQFYRQTATLSTRRELKDQLARAASSVALNLAEGRGKPTHKDQVRFFHIAMGSVRECQAILLLANLQASQAWLTLDCLAAHLFKLIQAAR
jgi:four helix bundle protein